MGEPGFVPFDHQERTAEQMIAQADSFRTLMSKRRTVREFSDRHVPREIIDMCIRTAITAPSGANMQPWHFVVVTDPLLKRQIRVAAEREEHEFYTSRAPKEWLAALAPLGTDEHKPYLETAPYLIVVFQQLYGVDAEGNKTKHYYATESVGLAAGLLIAAVHNAGLASLTHTPSPMGFLNTILGRPENEKAFLILVVGYPAENARVPVIEKKRYSDVITWT